MPQREHTYSFRGMAQDLDPSKVNTEFSFRNQNIRFTPNGENTFLSMVNERGTKEILSISGTPIGVCVIEQYCVIFCHSDNIININDKNINDIIYRCTIDENGGFNAEIWYSGNLNFSCKNPIEATGIYERSDLIKVYWVDGINQARLLNIAKDAPKYETLFDFNPKIGDGTISVEKNNSNGSFPAGMIQYCFTYFNENMQETNVVDYTRLLPITNSDRGSDGKTYLSTSFKISFKNINKDVYNYIRLYSIIRTTKDDIPTVRVVQDINISNSNGFVSFIDNGTTGRTIDQYELLYVGGANIIPYTIEHKDLTLFLGNLIENNGTINKSEINFSNFRNDNGELISGAYSLKIQDNQIDPIMRYDGIIDQGVQVPYAFKVGETYRLGCQFQDEYGIYSDVIWIGDYLVNPSNTLVGDVAFIYFDIPKEVIDKLDKKYKYVRPLYAEPTIYDKTIIAQGVINPCVYNLKDRENNSPYVQSSWCTRIINKPKKGVGFVPWGDNDRLSYSGHKEVQNISDIGDKEDESSSWYVTWEYVTFNSPDIELNSKLNTIDFSKYKARLIGFASSNKAYVDCSITTMDKPELLTGMALTGEGEDYQLDNILPAGYRQNFLKEIDGGGILTDFDGWEDWVYNSKKQNNGTFIKTSYSIFIWMRDYLSNVSYLSSDWDKNNKFSDRKPCKIDHKRISSYNVFNYCSSIETKLDLNEEFGYISKWDSEEMSMIKVPYSYSENKIYYGNIDNLIETNKSYSFGRIDGITWYDNVKCDHTKDSVRMKYKSNKHLVIKTGRNFYSKMIEMANSRECVPMVEIYNPNVINRYGGTSEEALSNNRWVIGGDKVKINRDKQFTRITYNQGDTNYFLYESLRTYPFTLEDSQTYVDLCAFCCSSNVNLNYGRFDRNFGIKSHLAIIPEVFNLYNPVYEQLNNFFQAIYLYGDRYNVNDFKSQITWSLQKNYAELNDSWTKITMTSNLNLDGEKGFIRKIVKFNDKLFAFQDRCISAINFNSRAAIPVSDGVPIEISNSGKVDGKINLTEIGCTNKWSICKTPNGIYFVDELTKGIYFFNGELVNLSDKLFFHSWVKNNSEYNIKLPIWNPVDFTNFVSYYDILTKDVYFIKDDDCLAYNENLQCFTSFYSYDETPYMFNFKDKFFSLRKKNKYVVNPKAIRDNHDGIINEAPFETLSATDDSSSYYVWQNNAGRYNELYNVYKNFYIHWISNPDYQEDKIFDNIEFRSDAYSPIETNVDNNDFKIEHFITFDTLSAWTEYQFGIFKLFNRMGHTSNLKKKFRVWRANIPRNLETTKNPYCNGHDYTSVSCSRVIKRFDRMRNSWCNLKLSWETPHFNKNILHDIVVKYFDNKNQQQMMLNNYNQQQYE